MNICAYAYLCNFMFICECLHMDGHILTYALSEHMFANTCVREYVYIHLCMGMYVCVYIYIYVLAC